MLANNFRNSRTNEYTLKWKTREIEFLWLSWLIRDFFWGKG